MKLLQVSKEHTLVRLTHRIETHLSRGRTLHVCVPNLSRFRGYNPEEARQNCLAFYEQLCEEMAGRVFGDGYEASFFKPTIDVNDDGWVSEFHFGVSRVKIT